MKEEAHANFKLALELAHHLAEKGQEFSDRLDGMNVPYIVATAGMILSVISAEEFLKHLSKDDRRQALISLMDACLETRRAM